MLVFSVLLPTLEDRAIEAGLDFNPFTRTCAFAAGAEHFFNLGSVPVLLKLGSPEVFLLVPITFLFLCLFAFLSAEAAGLTGWTGTKFDT